MFLSVLLLHTACDGWQEAITASCYFDDARKPTVELGPLLDSAAAWATFSPSLNHTGWDSIHLKTNANKPALDQSYCAGYLEGYLTHERLYNSFYMYKIGLQMKNNEFPTKWSEWMQQNIDYVDAIASQPKDDYDRSISYIYSQTKGLLDGYNSQAEKKMTLLDMWFFQSAGDLDDLVAVWDPDLVLSPDRKDRCTGLIRVLPDYSDFFFSQDTWSDYTELSAQVKEYTFAFAANKHVVLSTRTGRLASLDDFWMNSAGLLIMETTMHNFNATLYTLVKPQSILTWMRSLHATFVASEAKQWTEEFIKENSGTYNNQYIVIDSKKFTPFSKPQEGFMWMIEQYPGIYESQDMTPVLLKQGYFGSVNAPYFDDMFKIADYPGQQKREPWKAAFWSYWDQPRYRIIQRDAASIGSYKAFKKFMRYNDWKHDPLIKGEPAQGILSRYDLRPPNGTAFGARNHFGGLDSKTVRYSLTKGLVFDIINSPQYETNPPFNFNDWPELEHPGLIDEWKFGWTFFGSDEFNSCGTLNVTKEDCKADLACGWCEHSAKCLPAEDDKGPVSGFSCASGWSVGQHQTWGKGLIISVTIIVFAFVIAVYAIHFYYNAKEQEYNAL